MSYDFAWKEFGIFRLQSPLWSKSPHESRITWQVLTSQQVIQLSDKSLPLRPRLHRSERLSSPTRIHLGQMTIVHKVDKTVTVTQSLHCKSSVEASRSRRLFWVGLEFFHEFFHSLHLVVAMPEWQGRYRTSFGRALNHVMSYTLTHAIPRC